MQLNDLVAAGSTRIAVPPGGTLALFNNPPAGCQWQQLQYASGGSCEIVAFTSGSTIVGDTLGFWAGKGYLMTSTAMVIPGPARFYLSATGATSVVHAIYGMNAVGATLGL